MPNVWGLTVSKTQCLAWVLVSLSGGLCMSIAAVYIVTYSSWKYGSPVCGSSGPLVAGSFPTHIHISVERKKALSTSPPYHPKSKLVHWARRSMYLSAVIIKGIVKKGSFLLFMFTHFEWYVSVCLLTASSNYFFSHTHAYVVYNMYTYMAKSSLESSQSN